MTGLSPRDFPPNPNGPNDAPIIVYGYVPSSALSILGIVIFLASAVAQITQLARYKQWYCLPLVIGNVMEVVGYIFRTLSSRVDPYNIIYFVGQYFCIVVAPVLFSISIYIVISIMITIHGRQYSPLPPKVVFVGFAVCDVVATVLQVAGAASVGKAYRDRRDPTTYNHILLAGLSFQVFAFFCFILCKAYFDYKAWNIFNAQNKQFVVAFALATTMVYLRTCFRLAETAEGLQSYLSTHEAYFGCLEFLPIVVAVTIFAYWYPPRWLKKESGASGPYSPSETQENEDVDLTQEDSSRTTEAERSGRRRVVSVAK